MRAVKVLVSFALFCLSGFAVITAQTPGAERLGDGVDVIFVVETSSRYGPDAGGSDPTLRIDALEYAASLLVRDAVLHNPGVQHRMSVVRLTAAQADNRLVLGLDDPASTFGPFGDDDGNIETSDLDQIALLADRITAPLEAGLRQNQLSTEINDSRYIDALDVALNQFDDAAPPNRQRIVILVTAGVPQGNNPRDLATNVLQEIAPSMAGRSLHVIALPTGTQTFDMRRTQSPDNTNVWLNGSIPVTRHDLNHILGGGRSSAAQNSDAFLREGMLDSLIEVIDTILMDAVSGDQEVMFDIIPEADEVVTLEMPYFTAAATIRVFSRGGSAATFDPTPNQRFSLQGTSLASYVSPHPGTYRISNASRARVRLTLSEPELRERPGTAVQWTHQRIEVVVRDLFGEPYNYRGSSTQMDVTFTDTESTTAYTIQTASSERATGEFEVTFIPRDAVTYGVSATIARQGGTTIADTTAPLASFPTDSIDLQWFSADNTVRLFLPQTLLFQVIGLPENVQLAVSPTFTIEDAETLLRPVTLSRQDSAFAGEAQFRRPGNPVTLSIAASLSVPEENGGWDFSDSSFDTFTVRTAPLTASLTFPSTNSMYTTLDFTPSLTQPDSLPQSGVAQFDLVACARIETPDGQSVYRRLNNSFQPETPYLIEQSGLHTLQIALRQQCTQESEVVVPISESDWSAEQVYFAFMSEDRPILPVLAQFETATFAIGLFRSNGGRVSAPYVLPPLEFADASIVSITQQQAQYDISLPAVLDATTLTLTLADSSPIPFLPMPGNSDDTLRLNVLRAPLRVTIDDSSSESQQFGQANIIVALETAGPTPLNAREVVNRFGVTAQAELTLLDPMRRFTPVSLDLLSGNEWRGMLPLPLDGDYQIAISLLDATGARIGSTISGENVTLSVEPVTFTVSTLPETVPAYARTPISLTPNVNEINLVPALQAYGLSACAIVSENDDEVTQFPVSLSESASPPLVLTRPGSYAIHFELRRTCSDSSTRYGELTIPRQTLRVSEPYLALVDETGQPSITTVAQYLDATRTIGVFYDDLSGIPVRYTGGMDYDAPPTVQIDDGETFALPDDGIVTLPAQLGIMDRRITVTAPFADGSSLSFDARAGQVSGNTLVIPTRRAAPSITSLVAAEGEGNSLDQFGEAVISFAFNSQEGDRSYSTTDFIADNGTAEVEITIQRDAREPFTLPRVPLLLDGDQLTGRVRLPLDGTAQAQVVLRSGGTDLVSYSFPEATTLTVRRQPLTLSLPSVLPMFARNLVEVTSSSDTVRATNQWAQALADANLAICLTISQDRQAMSVPMTFDAGESAFVYTLETSQDGTSIAAAAVIAPSPCQAGEDPLEILQTVTVSVVPLYMALLDNNRPFVPTLNQFTSATYPLGLVYPEGSQAMLFNGSLNRPFDLMIEGEATVNAELRQVRIDAPVTRATRILNFDGRIGEQMISLWDLGAATVDNRLSLNVMAPDGEIRVEVQPEGRLRRFGLIRIAASLVSEGLSFESVINDLSLNPRVRLVQSDEVQHLIPMRTVDGDVVSASEIPLAVGGDHQVFVELAMSDGEVVWTETLEGGLQVDPLSLAFIPPSEVMEINQRYTFALAWHDEAGMEVSAHEIGAPPTVKVQINRSDGTPEYLEPVTLIPNDAGGYTFDWTPLVESNYSFDITYEAATATSTQPYSERIETPEISIGSYDQIKLALVGAQAQTFYNRIAVLPIFDFVPLLEPGVHNQQQFVFEVVLWLDADKDDQLDEGEADRRTFEQVFGDTDPTRVLTINVAREGGGTEGVIPSAPVFAPAADGTCCLVTIQGLESNQPYTFTAIGSNALQGFRLAGSVPLSATLTQSRWMLLWPLILWGGFLTLISGSFLYCRIVTNSQQTATPHLTGSLKLTDQAGNILLGWTHDLSTYSRNTIFFGSGGAKTLPVTSRVRVTKLDPSSPLDRGVMLTIWRKGISLPERIAGMSSAFAEGFSLCRLRDLLAGKPEIYIIEAGKPFSYAPYGEILGNIELVPQRDDASLESGT